MNNIIDLSKYQVSNGRVKSKVFTGRDRGKMVREKSNLDKIFDQYDNVHVIIPSGIFSITPSFLEEFFFNVVKKYGKEKFIEKIKITDNGYKIWNQLNEAINRILQEKNGLDL